MYDISNKDEIVHKAISQSIIRSCPETLEYVKNNKTFEISLVESAKISATLAAKKSWEIIPYSHQKTIDYVKVEVSIRSEIIEIIVEIKSMSKSSLDIESLSAASAAAITIFDKLSTLGDSTLIESIRVLRDEDIISESKERTGKKIRVGVIVTGDSEFLKEKAIQVEKFTVDRLCNNNFEVVESHLIKSEHNTIESEIMRLCDKDKVDLVITFGGMEFKSENTVSVVTEKLVDKKIDGIPEMLRAFGAKRIPLTILYRGIAGTRGKSIIINFPGNIKEISGLLDILCPYILHINRIVVRN